MSEVFVIMKKVFLPFVSTHGHNMYKKIMEQGIPGWQFVTIDSPTNTQTTISKPKNKKGLLERIYYSFSFIRGLYFRFNRTISFIINPKKLLALQSHIRNYKKYKNCDLIFSPNGMPIFFKKPWVTDVEIIHNAFIGEGNPKHLKRHRKSIQRMLASPYCKKIMPLYDTTRKDILRILDCSKFKDKIETVYFGIKSKKIKKNYNQKTVDILFINSANKGYETQFYGKGGKEVVLSYLKLRKNYKNVRLIIRSGDIPKDIMKLIAGKKDIVVIQERLPFKELEKLYLNSSVFFLPCFNAPISGFLEAMNYALPIITQDGFACKEFVHHNKNGFVVKRTRFIKECSRNLSNKLENIYKGHLIDDSQIDEFVEKLSLLVEDKNLRKKMSQNSKKLVEPAGMFSIETRQKKLKKIFDQAI